VLGVDGEVDEASGLGREQPRRTLVISTRPCTKQIASRMLCFSKLRKLGRVEGRVSARGCRRTGYDVNHASAPASE
jgi:hypothetical protein